MFDNNSSFPVYEKELDKIHLYIETSTLSWELESIDCTAWPFVFCFVFLFYFFYFMFSGFEL